jgi:hypothetical protein
MHRRKFTVILTVTSASLPLRTLLKSDLPLVLKARLNRGEIIAIIMYTGPAYQIYNGVSITYIPVRFSAPFLAVEMCMCVLKSCAMREKRTHAGDDLLVEIDKIYEARRVRGKCNVTGAD